MTSLRRPLAVLVALTALGACTKVDADRDRLPEGQGGPATTFVAPTTVDPRRTDDPSTDTAPVTVSTLAPRGRVAVVGDSLTKQSADHQERHLRAAGWDPVVIDGVPGAPISSRVEKIREVIAEHDLDVLVIALGTNDARIVSDSGGSLAEGWYVTQASAFTALADAQAVPCVVWVGVNANSTKWHIDFWGGGFNTWLRRYASVADWTAYSKAHPEWFDVDTIHLLESGRDAYARLITETVESTCPAKLPPTPR